MPITDDQVDALLSAAGESGMTDIDLAMRMQERRRKRAHAKAKATQADLGVRATPAHPALMAKLKAAWDAPITDDEKSAAQGDIEYLTLTIQDCVGSGDAEDLIFASMRLARKILARTPHLWRKQDMEVKKPGAGTVS